MTTQASTLRLDGEPAVVIAADNGGTIPADRIDHSSGKCRPTRPPRLRCAS